MTTKQSGRSKLTVALLIDNEEVLRQVNEILNKNFPPQDNNSQVAVVGQWGDLYAGFDKLKDCKPTIAILGLCSKENPGVHLLAERISASLSETKVFIISIDKDQENLLKALRAGVKEYLTSPVNASELIMAIGNIKTSLELKMAVGSPRTIGVISVKGGSGCTTAAINLAVALKLITKKTVLLLDACLSGDVALFLNLKYRYTLKDVLENLDRLDPALLASYVVEHPSGVRVIPAVEPEDSMLGEWPFAVSKEIALQALIDLISKEYNYIVVDVGTILFKEKKEILKQLDIILLVLPLELSALRNGAKEKRVLEGLGLLDNMRLVVNRYDKRYTKAGCAISPDDVTKTMEMPIFTTIPNDYLLVSESINLGTVLVMEKPKSPVAQSFLRLAELLSKTKVSAQG
ncbi:MAG TPA: AAA family ATPase [Candidatus Hypogeohydataceae bacterium YC41]